MLDTNRLYDVIYSMPCNRKVVGSNLWPIKMLLMIIKTSFKLPSYQTNKESKINKLEINFHYIWLLIFQDDSKKEEFVVILRYWTFVHSLLVCKFKTIIMIICTSMFKYLKNKYFDIFHFCRILNWSLKVVICK